MRYTFVKVQCHPKVPDLLGWYLLIRKQDQEIYSDIHISVTTRNTIRTQRDPHNYDGIRYKGVYEHLLNPLTLSLKWLEATTRYLEEGPILINKNGGWMDYDPKFEKDRIIKDKMVFPEDSESNEIITIKRWQKHWYLSSSKDRIFVPEKTNSLKDAEKMALNYVGKENIRVDENRELGIEP